MRTPVRHLADSYRHAGRWDDALQLLSEWVPRLPDYLLGTLELCALQVWCQKKSAHVETCRELLDRVADTQNATSADRAAKGYCLVPSTDQRLLDLALTLARRAVILGKNDLDLPWFQMGLGMAEYRAGNFSAADQSLLAAMETLEAPGERVWNPSVWNPKETRPIIRSTVQIYHAMSLLRQGNLDESRKVLALAESEMKPVPEPTEIPKGAITSNDLICWLAYKEAKALLESTHHPIRSPRFDSHDAGSAAGPARREIR
jgi:hypothetical protein